MADHRGLVTHRVDAGQQPVQYRALTHVADDDLVPGQPVRQRVGAVRLGQQGIQHDRLVVLSDQQVGDVGADETGTTGHEYTPYSPSSTQHRGVTR